MVVAVRGVRSVCEFVPVCRLSMYMIGSVMLNYASVHGAMSFTDPVQVALHLHDR